jgi:hypothetical protein
MSPRIVWLKAITIGLGALSIPWSMFVGYSFGQGHWVVGTGALCGEVIVYVVDSLVWWRLMEIVTRGNNG